jgi:hypothetical protein
MEDKSEVRSGLRAWWANGIKVAAHAEVLDGCADLYGADLWGGVIRVAKEQHGNAKRWYNLASAANAQKDWAQQDAMSAEILRRMP